MTVLIRAVLSAVVVSLFSRNASAQATCDEGVRARLAQMLATTPAQLGTVTRDYSAGMFAGATFYRAERQNGFHAGTRSAALVVVGRDSIQVGSVADLDRTWQALHPAEDTIPGMAGLYVRELLFQTGILRRQDEDVSSGEAIPSSYKAFLPAGADLSAIRPPEESRQSGATRVTFFVLAAEGVVRYSALVSASGLHATREVIARLQMN
jgi:hypothetical protein